MSSEMNSPVIVGAGTSGLSLAYYLRRFDTQSIEFVDGQSLACDVVIFATGYQNGLSSLIGHLGTMDSQGRLRRPESDANDCWPGLWIFGMRPRLVGNIRARVLEARQLAAAIAHQEQ